MVAHAPPGLWAGSSAQPAQSDNERTGVGLAVYPGDELVIDAVRIRECN